MANKSDAKLANDIRDALEKFHNAIIAATEAGLSVKTEICGYTFWGAPHSRNVSISREI